ncbi:CYTH and CHAD domain-containing protein [Cryobacterium sp. 1639]|uniref:CYTH and CHAD domain-containing protein n=1 Tax=Cryobacterium inferilacus TaxID=2866629 RepID=UPI001C738EFF|nr:CYTH and CHAD domain-containing protein [Cryobacterium sp. 1639]MBX0299733.1 CYTH and CHAD domain-containing protein [Cryobacterium sp. 1639]
MTGREQTEIERKYDVEGLTPVPTLTGIDGVSAQPAQEPFILTAVYYDTADNALAKQRIVLRRREGGGDAGWHLKKPAAEGRTEVHWPLDVAGSDHPEQIPDEVLEPVRAIVRDRPLTPLARVNTVRTTVQLTDTAGQALAEIADDVVSASDVRGGTYRKWREWEVELLDGAPDSRKKRVALLDAVEKVLLAAGAAPSTSVAKIARAVGVDSLTELDGTEVQPGLLPAPALQDPGSVGAIVVAALRDLTATLLADDPLARADAPDAIHTMRTTVRRLRSVLAVYAGLFDPAVVKDLRRELKHLGVGLGHARDAEVREARLAEELAGVTEYPTEDARTRLVGGARRDHAAGVASARELLLTPRYYRLLDSLEEFAAWPPLTPAADRPAARQITRALTKAVGTLEHRAAAAAETDASEPALHEVRKAARRLRYAAAAVAVAQPVSGEPETPAAPQKTGEKSGKKARKKAAKKAARKRAEAAARFDTHRRKYARIARAAKPVVKMLGDRHDTLLYIEQLDSAAQAAHESGENTLVYGLLVARAERPGDTAAAVLGKADHVVHTLKRMVRAS